MKLKEKKALECLAKLGNPHYPDPVLDAYQAGWDAALEFIAQRATVDVIYEEDYKDTNVTLPIAYIDDLSRAGEIHKVMVSKKSILAGKDIEA